MGVRSHGPCIHILTSLGVHVEAFIPRCAAMGRRTTHCFPFDRHLRLESTLPEQDLRFALPVDMPGRVGVDQSGAVYRCG